jgi:hypothetical protein
MRVYKFVELNPFSSITDMAFGDPSMKTWMLVLQNAMIFFVTKLNQDLKIKTCETFIVLLLNYYEWKF